MMKGMVYMKNRPAPLIIALILIIAGFGIPIMTRVYWVIPPVLTALIILGAIILLVVLQRRRTAEKAGISEELCSDISFCSILVRRKKFCYTLGQTLFFKRRD